MSTQPPSYPNYLPPSPHAPPTLGTALHLEVAYRASAERLYEALLDERRFTAWSGAEARIERSEGGAFRLVGGRVSGRNIELVANRRIVQAWHVATWAEGAYSIVRFELHPTAEGTRVVLDHSGFAPEDLAARRAGWFRVYLDPLRNDLEA